MSFPQLLALDLPERKAHISWLSERAIAMVYGARGIGKTQFALSVAIALSSGSPFLNWSVTDKVGVLYVDGEMPLADLLERVVALSGARVPEHLSFLTSEMVYRTLDRDLTLTKDSMRHAVQEILDTHPTIQVLILDNISCLFSGISEDRKQNWEPINAWLIGLRHRGVSTLLVHHAGKGGNQRGTSGREDILDTVIALQAPPDYDPQEGCHFHVRFTKSRGIKGDIVKPLDARLTDDHTGSWGWQWQSLELSQREQVVALLDDGVAGTKTIADEVGCSERYVRKIRRERDGGM